jgi:hypothetical protein
MVRRQDADPLAHRGRHAQREKKIAQLNDFIARSRRARARARCSRGARKSSGCETTALARSNIQRPYIRSR